MVIMKYILENVGGFFIRTQFYFLSGVILQGLWIHTFSGLLILLSKSSFHFLLQKESHVLPPICRCWGAKVSFHLILLFLSLVVQASDISAYNILLKLCGSPVHLFGVHTIRKKHTEKALQGNFFSTLGFH